MKINMRITQIVLAVFVAVSLSCSATKPTKIHPNIILITSDDHAIQAISAYGHGISKVAPTPNIDRIAENGAIFNKAYCTNSLCGPSRATILTGKFSHINGFTRNRDKFDQNQPTLPKYLQVAGYETAIVGKWHLKGVPTQGFDYWEVLNDQGEYYNPDFISGKDTVMNHGYATDLIMDKSLDWLQKGRDKDKPFMLMVQNKAPHRNWWPAERHYNRYDSVSFPVPDTYFDNYDGRVAADKQKMNIYRDMYEGHDLKMTVAAGVDSFRYDPWPHLFNRATDEQKEKFWEAYRPVNDAFHQMNLNDKELALWKYQRYLQDYMGTIAAVDENVGRLLDYLEKSGLDENTIVIYTSDQGFYLGEHGFFDKRFMYEESFRTPLLIQYPGAVKPGTQIDQMVQNLDFAQTILDFCGLEQPDDMQGLSFKPLLLNKKVDKWRDALYYHFYEFPGFHSVSRHYGVRTERYKLIHFYHKMDEWELYDLQRDPSEMNNLYGQPGYEEITRNLKKRLDELQEQYKETI
ncbi:sulfatase [Carboxylicivirga sediminis]|uniref:Sulfatase n=1 Tax=Carboxylicivirga sediminis TaxID=2006564 RepID=A0A941F141_9BACT|nr:sulfatase [Carboxylicivirga sediminis]MBR8534489.1 sulfatase [Carboxylicivirga sediminis]